MKKLSRKNLDELAMVMPVLSETEQRMFVGGNSGGMPSGPDAEIYTWEQYWSMNASGTWTGGYVEGYGYVTPDVTITADGTIQQDFSGSTIAFAAVEGVGITGNIIYNGYSLIENGNMTVIWNVAVPRFGNNVNASGEVLVYVNGTQVLCQSLSTSSSIIYDPAYIPLGSTTFNLSQYSGQVEVKVRMGYTNYSDGNYGVYSEETIYSVYR